MNPEFWNNRYSNPAFIFGKNPNAFLQRKLTTLDPGTLLLPCEGEGRNAVFAASLGWDVSAFDQSEIAREKALRLAKSRGFSINYKVADARTFRQTFTTSFDVVACTFVHMPDTIRPQFHRDLVKSLKHGGYIILQGFGKKQTEYSSGGPTKEPSMLFDTQTLKNDFQNMQILELIDNVEELNEGLGHKGPGHLISLFARKPLD